LSGQHVIAPFHEADRRQGLHVVMDTPVRALQGSRQCRHGWFRVMNVTQKLNPLGRRGCSGGTLDFNFFVKNGLAEFLMPSQWLRTTYEAPYQRYE
jgi:hypothetical protein